jgi:hypothetical protein
LLWGQNQCVGQAGYPVNIIRGRKPEPDFYLRKGNTRNEAKNGKDKNSFHKRSFLYAKGKVADLAEK